MSTVQTVAGSLKTSKLADYPILALARNTNGHAAKELAKLPGVEVVEKTWTYIDADWLKEQHVERVFVASHNGPTQFTDESLFLASPLEAGVKYVVRISTTAGNVKPLSLAFYGRTHWAIDNLLSQPECASMSWASLKPAIFTDYVALGRVSWLKQYRETGKKETLRLFISKGKPIATIDPKEIGIVAGRLLLADDPSQHNGKGYVLVGPSNINGKQLVDLLAQHAGTTIDDVVYSDTSYLTPSDTFPENLIPSLKRGAVTLSDGSSSVELTPTSPEVTALYQR